jgi:hypothetical protein
MDEDANDIPAALLPAPQDVRRLLALRLREVDVLRRLLRVAEYAATELQRDSAEEDHGADLKANRCHHGRETAS